MCIRDSGMDIRDMKRGELRSLFGMVLQDTWLFQGSIYDLSLIHISADRSTFRKSV